jgi:cytochrome c-type biogenesis protein CcmH
MTISFSKIGISVALSLLAIWLAVLTPPAANAITAEEMLTDPALESRARDLSQQLRCLVCQNQSIDDSDADLARDLRREVRIQLLAGADDNAILSQLRQKYGDYVLLNPPVDQSTLVLWLAPIGFVALGAFLVLVARRQKTDQKTDLDSDERARVERLLASRNSEEQAKT